ncbi:MAG: PEP-CTERM sorting domain-containing protein [Deferribacteres bacterium]|nr:PEP-CTERM sorting domain-containing protein [Deferribacteres bacterium]
MGISNKLKTILLALGALFIVTNINTANATIIDLNARYNTTSNPVSLFLTKGTYEVTPIGIADGGIYNAWNAWGYTYGCDSSGANCRTGWINAYSLSSSEFAAVTYYDGIRYATPYLALANAINSSFTLSIDTTVDFFIADRPYYDNVGGISLNVTAAPAPAPVPEPSTLLLLGSGFLGVAALRKRIKNLTVA